jgi:hypothetical protein
LCAPRRYDFPLIDNLKGLIPDAGQSRMQSGTLLPWRSLVHLHCRIPDAGYAYARHDLGGVRDWNRRLRARQGLPPSQHDIQAL